MVIGDKVMRFLFSLVVLQSLWHRLSSGNIEYFLFPPHVRNTPLHGNQFLDLSNQSFLMNRSQGNPSLLNSDQSPNVLAIPVSAQQSILALGQNLFLSSFLRDNLQSIGQFADPHNSSPLISMRSDPLKMGQIIEPNKHHFDINAFNLYSGLINNIIVVPNNLQLDPNNLMFFPLFNMEIPSKSSLLISRPSNVISKINDGKIIALSTSPLEQVNSMVKDLDNTDVEEIQETESKTQGTSIDASSEIIAPCRQSTLLKETTTVHNDSEQKLEAQTQPSQNNPAANLTIYGGDTTTLSQADTPFGKFHGQVKDMVDQSDKGYDIFKDYSGEDSTKACNAWQTVVNHHFNQSKVSSYDYNNRSVTYSNPTTMSGDDFKHAVLLAIPRDIAYQPNFKLNANCSDFEVLLRFAQAVGQVNATCEGDNQKLKLDIDSMKKTSDYEIAEKGFNEHNTGLKFDETLKNLASGNTTSNKAIQELLELLGSASEQDNLSAASSRISISP
jgi:hypothetical protein